MGRFEIQSETVFNYECEVVWDLATNPNNLVRSFCDTLCFTSDKLVT